MKIDKRKLLGPLFPVLSRARHSPFTRRLEGWARLPRDLTLQWRNHPRFFVEASGTKGMGALICDVLLLIHFARGRGLEPHIVSFNPLYRVAPDRDVLREYFQFPAHVDLPRRRAMVYHNLHSWPHLKLPRQMTFHEASGLVREFFGLVPALQRIVDEQLARVPGGQFDLSVHYRATDKALEAPLVEFSKVIAAATQALALQPARDGASATAIFLATDSAEFRGAFLAAFPDAQVFTYELAADADFSRGRHFSSMSPHDKAQEALVNMHLLASSRICVRGASFMSAVSAFLNPGLRTVTLNADHWGSTGFPEREIRERETPLLSGGVRP